MGILNEGGAFVVWSSVEEEKRLLRHGLKKYAGSVSTGTQTLCCMTPI
jgi:hypothetical protein